MGSKAKKRPDTAYIFQQATRWLEKKNYRQALKDAKVCYRQEPNEKHRHLLERAYLARAQELLRSGLRRESQDAVQGLLDLGVTEPSVKNELPELLLALGMFDRTASKISPSAESDPLLVAKAADHAVLRPEESPASLAGIREGAQNVRAALEAIERGDEPAAMEKLKDIPRNSPFADWKLFARGLAAYYRHDAGGQGSSQANEEMHANWSRLDQDRMAARIAAPLAWLADPRASEPPQAINYPLRLLEKQAWGESISDFLASLQGNLAKERFSELFRTFKRSRETLKKHAPEILRRLEEFLCNFVLRKGVRHWLDGLITNLDPLAFDPHWNRAWAIVLEHPDDGDLNQAQDYWKAYLRDLENLACFTPDQRALARALVWERLGQQSLDDALNLDEEDDYDDYEDEEDNDFDDGRDEELAHADRWNNRDDARRGYAARAVECLNNAVRLAPHLLSAHEELAKAYLDWHKDDQAAEAYRRLLTQFPDHFAALTFLVHYHLRRDECFEMRDYALHALRLKPANAEALNMAWAGHIGAARLHAIRGEWDLGRAEFTAAHRLPCTPPDPHHLLVKKAVFELKAGNPDAAQEHIRQALEICQDPTGLNLMLLIESIRYQLPLELGGPRMEFEREWHGGLKKKKTSKAAGQMARTMLAYLGFQVDYPSRNQHVVEVVKYIRGCSRLRWQDADLEAACQFFAVLPDKQATKANYEFAVKLAQKGLKNFPKNPVYWHLEGNAEINKGPFKCRRGFAKQCFEKARDLAKDSAHPRAQEIVKDCEKRLSFLSNVEMGPPGFSFPPNFSFDDEYDYDDDDEASDDELPVTLDELAESMMGTIEKMAKSMGINPADIMEDLADELLPQFATHFKAAEKKHQTKAKKKGKR